MKFENTFIKLLPEVQTVERILEIAKKYSQASDYPVEEYSQDVYIYTRWKYMFIDSGVIRVSMVLDGERETEITEQDLDNYLQQMQENSYKDSDTDMENCKTPVEECCEGGALSAGCFHDHCEKGTNSIPPVTEWKCFQRVADVLGEENAEYELGKVQKRHLECDMVLDIKKPLSSSFSWWNTPQEHDFWEGIHYNKLPENYHVTPDVLPTPACDKFKVKLAVPDEVMGSIKETFIDDHKNSLDDLLNDVNETNKHPLYEVSNKSIGELIEDIYFKMNPTGVCITLSGDGTILLHGDNVPTVDVSKLEAEDIDKAYEALVMLEGLFVEDGTKPINSDNEDDRWGL